MTDDLQADLLRRVLRLERQLRWWRLLAGLALFLPIPATLALAESHGPSARQIQAQSFVLVDDEGRSRAELGFVPASDGSRLPGLVFRGKQGQITTQIDAFPSVNLLGKDERSRVTVSVRSDDDPTLEFIDSDGVKRVVLGHGEIKSPGTGRALEVPLSSLVLQGPDGKVVWRAP